MFLKRKMEVNMNYLEMIMEILQRATIEELFMVLKFAENVVVGKKEE